MTTNASIIAQEVVARLNYHTDILYNDMGERDQDIDDCVIKHIVDVLQKYDLDSQ